MKKIFVAIILILMIFYGIFALLSSFFAGILFFELYVSLFPYFFGLNLLILLILIMLVVKKSGFLLNSKRLLVTATILFTILTVIFGFKLFNFYYIKDANNRNYGESIKIAFFNKLFSNDNYEKMREGVLAKNPDIIGFAEATKLDILKLSLAEIYPYSAFIQDCSACVEDMNSIGNVILSKFPFQNIENPKNLAVKVRLKSKEITLVVVHPYAPVANSYLRIRNNQLTELGNFLNSKKDENLILMGDFNTSPWTQSYYDFTNKVSFLRNVAKGQGFNITWYFDLIPIGVQIDHIFVSENMEVESFEVEGSLSSDHRMIVSRIKV